MKKLYKNIFIVLLAINFCIAAYALMWAEQGTILHDIQLLLVVSFVVIAGFARKCCKNAKKEAVSDKK